MLRYKTIRSDRSDMYSLGICGCTCQTANKQTITDSLPHVPMLFGKIRQFLVYGNS